MSEVKKNAQQEIAPCGTVPIVCPINAPLPAEKPKKSGAGAFFRLPMTQRIVYTATFTALAVICKMFAVRLSPMNIISFLYIPCFLAGAFFGPVSGFAVGFLADILGAAFSGNAPSPIVSVGNGLSGVIMGLIFMYRGGKPFAKIILGALASLIIVTYGVNTYGLSSSYGDFSLTNYFAFFFIGFPLPRIAFQPIVLAINTVLIMPLYYVLERTLLKKFVRGKKNGGKNK